MAVVLGAAITGLAYYLTRPDCAKAVHNGSSDAVRVCQSEFDDNHDLQTGLRLARGLFPSDPAGAKRLAKWLLTTKVRSDALQLLGWMARNEDRNDDAISLLEEAAKLHEAEHRPRELARDDGLLALVRTDRNEFAPALQLTDECITQAQAAGDTEQQCTCHIVAARVLTYMGYMSAVKQELDAAEPLISNEDQRSDLDYRRGVYWQDMECPRSAVVYLGRALRRRRPSSNPAWAIKTELNLAYSLAETGEFDEARHHLQNAVLVDSDHEKEAERIWVAAQIAYRQHDLARAASLTEEYFRRKHSNDSIDRDDQIDVASLRARIELERNDLESAKHWAQEGVQQAESIRTAQPTLELRPWVLTKRRAPYELLFTALARGGHAEDAAMAFDQWQGRTVQDALATRRPPASLGRRDIAAQVTRLNAWLHDVPQTVFAGRPDSGPVLRTMRDIDLFALIVANGEVWRLATHHGPPQLATLGPLAQIGDRIAEFRGHPTKVELASDLGALLLPDDSFRTTREVLHVVVDERLTGLPVAALRRDGPPLIAMRPIVRLLRLPEIRCIHVDRSGPATVLAGPDLPGAKIPWALREAEQVAALLHTTSTTGAAANRAALFAAANDAVLHVASHSAIKVDGAALVLADGNVSALEIAASRGAPSLAVLSACDAATSGAPEIAGSLAAGFLAAGSQHVVATLRPISDDGAPKITIPFYRAGGVADPARALQAVQSKLADTANTDWPYFAVFGPDVCADAPDHQ